MPRVLRALAPLAFASLPVLVSACGATDDAPPTPSDMAAGPSSRASTDAGTSASQRPTGGSPGSVYVNEAGGWSIVVPPGWELTVNGVGGAALTRDRVIAEILVFPASGLTLEQLEAERVAELPRVWPGAEILEAQIVPVPAGDALRIVFTYPGRSPEDEPGILVSYAIEEGDRQYVVSVRGPQDDRDLLADAEALAESFAIID